VCVRVRVRVCLCACVCVCARACFLLAKALRDRSAVLESDKQRMQGREQQVPRFPKEHKLRLLLRTMCGVAWRGVVSMCV
jgi:energy-converting hydrogenase Eha subunit H